MGRPKRKKGKKPAINLRDVDESLYRKLKVRAAEQGMTLKDLVIEACREYLARQRVKPPKKPRTSGSTLTAKVIGARR